MAASEDNFVDPSLLDGDGEGGDGKAAKPGIRQRRVGSENSGSGAAEERKTAAQPADRKGDNKGPRRKDTADNKEGNGAAKAGQSRCCTWGRVRQALSLVALAFTLVSGVWLGLVSMYDDDGFQLVEADEGATILLSGTLVVSAAILVGLRRPRASGALCAAWTAWFLLALLRDQYRAAYGDGVEDSAVWTKVSARAHLAMTSTQQFVRAAGQMVAAWLRLLAPIATDSFELAGRVWATVSWEVRIGAILALVVVYGAYKAYLGVRARKDAIAHALGQMSYLIVGPVLWSAATYIPEKQLRDVVFAIITVIPALLSARSFRENRRGQRRAARGARAAYSDTITRWLLGDCARWLSYWSCWPLMRLAFLAADSSALQPKFRSRVLATLVVVTVYLQLWGGSQRFFEVVSSVGAKVGPSVLAVANVTPGMFPRRLIGPLLTAAAGIGSSPTRLWVFVKNNKLMSLMTVAVASLALITFGLALYRAATDALTVLIWWAVALKSARTVARKRGDEADILSFWVLAQLVEAVALVPVASVVVSLFRPLILPLLLAMGSDLLGLAVDRVGDSDGYVYAAVLAIYTATAILK